MFDVLWTDANRERVGERRARKTAEKDGDGKGKGDQRSSARTSLSTRSSLSSGERPFAFFAPHRNRKKSVSTDKTKSSFGAALRKSSVDNQSQRNSLFLAPVTTAGSGRPTSVVPVEGNNLRERFLLESGQSSPVSTSSRSSVFFRSVFKGWEDAPSISGFSDPPASSITGLSTGGPAILPGRMDGTIRKSWGGKTAQLLGPVSQLTTMAAMDKVTSRSHNLKTDMDDLLSGTKLSAEPTPDQLALPIFSGARPLPSALKVDTSAAAQSDPTAGPAKPRKRVAIRPPTTKFQAHQPSAWRPPDIWNCTSNQTSAASSIKEPAVIEPNDTEDASSLSLDLSGMQREVKRMAAAGPIIILRRLQEEWKNTPDANWYKEMEMEKKRYMLSALYNMDIITDLPGDERQLSSPRTVPRVQKILALYETAATASYLAAINHNCPIYHLAPAPLSHRLFPNVHPWVSLSTSHTAISTDLYGFSSVHCLSLPSLLPASDIPHLLRSIHKCLVPGGKLHLILIDPAPVFASVGPRMRNWLEENLMLNLAHQFRCTNPSKLLPMWLSDSSMRAAGSTITTTRFQAVPPSPRTGANHGGGGGDGQSGEDGSDKGSSKSGSAGGATPQQKAEQRVKVELRSTVGRMLWQEVWGQFVAAGDWWWDDPRCVEECLAMGTHWEYSLIEAVRDEEGHEDDEDEG